MVAAELVVAAVEGAVDLGVGKPTDCRVEVQLVRPQGLGTGLPLGCLDLKAAGSHLRVAWIHNHLEHNLSYHKDLAL